MHFSLILATIGRVEEPKRFLASLDRQSYRNFKLIVIDQNPDDRLKTVLQPYFGRFPVYYLRIEKKGVSHARNIGLQQAGGDIITFPDDDCWYPANLLEQVSEFFRKHLEWDGVTACVVDAEGTPSVGRWDKLEGPINRFNELTRSAESSIFVRRTVIECIGGFNEELGPGAGTPWMAHEGDDFILRALQMGFRFYYKPKFFIYHPRPVQRYDVMALDRARGYGCGMGRVLRKHSYPLWFVVYYWLRPLGGTLLALLKGDMGKARYYWATLKGRVYGWVSYK